MAGIVRGSKPGPESPRLVRLRQAGRARTEFTRARPAWCAAPPRQGLSGPALKNTFPILLESGFFSRITPVKQTALSPQKQSRYRRPQSKVENFFHLVWATHRRQPLLVPEWEAIAFRCIQSEVQRLQSTVLALNGMPDHVHLVVRLHATVSCAHLANQVKGVSAALLNDSRQAGSEHFQWQAGYASFTLSRSHLTRVIAYVERQKEHHTQGSLWVEWEQTELVLDAVAGA